jgi:hypothetical protein
MSEVDQELESRFIKLMLSSALKTVTAINPEVDALETVRGHMLEICGGVRQRALDSAGEGVTPAVATAQVDALIAMINEYFDYSASPLFPDVTLVKR